MKRIIYALTEPTGEVRYVGITRNSLAWRLTRHICDARKKHETNHRSCWIRSLLAKSLTPLIVELETTEDLTRERFWILKYRAEGARLTNASDGCESHLSYSPPQSVRDAISKAKRGKPISPHHRAALIKAITGRPMSAKAKAALIESNHARRNRATHCKHGHEFTPENTLSRPEGYRQCKACRQAIKRRHNARLKLARQLA